MKSNGLPATVLMTAALLLSGACGSDDGKGAATPSPSRTTPAPRLIDYGDGIELKEPADVLKLHDAPEDFKQFIAGVAGEVATPESKTDKCGPYILVNKVDTSGYASGAVFDCGGAALMWGKWHGVWQQVWGGQDTPSCDDLKKFAIPKDIAGDKCWDGKDEVAYTG